MASHLVCAHFDSVCCLCFHSLSAKPQRQRRNITSVGCDFHQPHRRRSNPTVLPSALSQPQKVGTCSLDSRNENIRVDFRCDSCGCQIGGWTRSWTWRPSSRFRPWPRLHKIPIPQVWEGWWASVGNPPPAAGCWAEPRLNSLSVAIWMQHLAVIYAKAEKVL